MNSKKNTNRTKGILGSILLHVIILIALFFLGLKSQDPPPKEEGISINFGFIEDGSDNIQPEQQEEPINEINEEKIIDITESQNDIITQSEEEAPILKEKVEVNQTAEKESKEEIIRTVIDIGRRLDSPESIVPGTPKSSIVVGEVQSGKTAVMIGLVAMGLDHGFENILYCTGDNFNLAHQGTIRLDDYTGRVTG